MDAAAGVSLEERSRALRHWSDQCASGSISADARAPSGGTRPAPLDEGEELVYASFIAAYSAEYGEEVRPYSFTANAYDAAWLVAYGAAWAVLREDGISGTHIARGLRRLSSGDPVEIRRTNWNRVKQVFAGGGSVDVDGASGQLDYDPTTEETSANVESWRIESDAIAGIYLWTP